MTTLVACDGSCLKNPGGAIGWAWAREDGAWMSNGWKTGTNQRAELLALISVLTFHPRGHLTIQMDSQYALNIADKWAAGWARKGWRKADGQPILNRDLVEPLLSLKQARTDPIVFQWVKGHRKDNKFPLNTVADLRAGEASKRAKEAKDAVTGMNLYQDSKGRSFMRQEAELVTRLSLLK